jgi:hypothetical protein
VAAVLAQNCCAAEIKCHPFPTLGTGKIDAHTE